MCEVPRGMLIHHYWINADGNLTGANCIIPTNQNLANLEADMKALVPTILDKPVEAMQLDLEMLVRAYDPCISCSVHVLKIEPRSISVTPGRHERHSERPAPCRHAGPGRWQFPVRR